MDMIGSEFTPNMLIGGGLIAVSVIVVAVVIISRIRNRDRY